jgi:propanol-preferring alcohol dehydrogenase
MRAWVVATPGPIETRPLELREVPSPPLAPEDVRIRVEACGVCRTDLHIAEGDLRRTHPIIPGHQIVGRVIERGRSVRGVDEGDLAGVTWLASACGECEFCQEGRENLCREAQFTGLDRAGGYAEEVCARGDYLVRLPASWKARDAAPFLCAGVIGYRAFTLAGVKTGQRLGLIGFGASARLTLQLALHHKCEVVVFTREESHRQAALALGASRAHDLRWAASADCHGIILFAPAGNLVPFGLRQLRKGGTLVVNAVHSSDIPSFPYSILYEERSVRSVAHLTRRDAREFLELVTGAGLRTEAQPFGFAQANEALLAVKESKVLGQAVLEFA